MYNIIKYGTYDKNRVRCTGSHCCALFLLYNIKIYWPAFQSFYIPIIVIITYIRTIAQQCVIGNSILLKRGCSHELSAIIILLLSRASVVSNDCNNFVVSRGIAPTVLVGGRGIAERTNQLCKQNAFSLLY